MREFFFAGAIVSIVWFVVISAGVHPKIFDGLSTKTVLAIGLALGVIGILGVMSELKELYKEIRGGRK